MLHPIFQRLTDENNSGLDSVRRVSYPRGKPWRENTQFLLKTHVSVTASIILHWSTFGLQRAKTQNLCTTVT